MTPRKSKQDNNELDVPSPTLKSFIEENHRLLTVLGVFTALTIFASNLPVKPLGGIISFLFMTLTIILWLELWAQFPSARGGWRIVWFESLLGVTILFLVFYWLLDYRIVWDQMLVVLILIVILAPFLWAMKKFNIFNRLFHTQPGKLRFLRYVFGIIILLAVIFLSFYIASLLAGPINTSLDALMRTPTATLP
jgi:hypothetical protein